jgi:hypothetical protein
MIFGWRRHWQQLELPCPFHPTPELSPCGGLDSCTRRTAPGAALRGLELAGSDKVWHAARARIDGETMIVSADGVATPLGPTLRGRHQATGATSTIRQGLPASLFCSKLDCLPWPPE